MTIKRTKVGSKAGTLSNPGAPCHGTLRVTARATGASTCATRSTTRTRRKCTGDDRIFVKRKGKRLSWQATAPSGQVGTAILRRA